MEQNRGVLSSFAEMCDLIGISLTSDQNDKFDHYQHEIERWTVRIPLVSSGDLEKIPERHFLDSIYPLSLGLISEGERVVDIGSGAGFPGIPLAICRPDIEMTLIESSQKKGAFLNYLSRSLRLGNVNVIIDRVESDLREVLNEGGYDAAVSRAVASIDSLVKWSFPILTPEGRLLAFKGRKSEDDIAVARERVSGWSDEGVERYRTISPISRVEGSIVVIRKIYFR